MASYAANIRKMVESAPYREEIGEDTTKLIYVGFDTRGRALEVITFISHGEEEIVIHAMKLRKQYHHLLRRIL